MDADHSHDDLLDDGGDWSSSESESDGFNCALDASHICSDSVLQLVISGSGPLEWVCILNQASPKIGVLTREFQWVGGVCQACIPDAKDMVEQVYQMWQRVHADLCKKQAEAHALNASPASASASASAPASASGSSSTFTSASAPISAATGCSKRKTENVKVVVTDSDSDVEVTAPSRPAKKPKH